MKAEQRKQRKPEHNKPQYTYEVNGMITKTIQTKRSDFRECWRIAILYALLRHSSRIVKSQFGIP